MEDNYFSMLRDFVASHSDSGNSEELVRSFDALLDEEGRLRFSREVRAMEACLQGERE